MAAPYVAGAAALLLQASKEGKTNLSETILERFRSTAMPVFNSTNSSRGVIDTVAKQGAGLLQMINAIHYNTHVSLSCAEECSCVTDSNSRLAGDPVHVLTERF